MVEGGRSVGAAVLTGGGSGRWASELGNSGAAGEVADRVLERMNVSDKEQEPTTSNGQSRVRNQVGWARFYLTKAEAADASIAPDIEKEAPDADTENHLEELIGILRALPPAGFERICQRLLRESGFQGDSTAVTPSQIRDFRGAMQGRADKGLVLTTGEATRDGAPPIELVDGEKLVRMFEQAQLGLRPRQTYEVDVPFFEEFRK